MIENSGPGKRVRFGALLRSPWMALSLCVFTFVVCGLRSFVFPVTPILFWGDALGYATKGARILHGEVPYRDFFEFVTPGTDLVYALLFRWAGPSLWILNFLMCVVAAVTVLWTTWCAQKLVTGRFVLLPGLLVTGFVLSGSLDPTHHWFSTLCVLGAVGALFNGVSRPGIVAAGAMCGLAASFTQSTGAAVLLGLIAFLCCRPGREPREGRVPWTQCMQLCGAALLVFAAVNLPFVLAAGLHRWFGQVVVFPLRYFGSVPANNWRGMGIEFAARKGVLKWLTFPFMYVAVPLSYVWTIVEVRSTTKGEGNRQSDRLLLLALSGLAMLAVIAPALSIRRLSCASPPAMVLLACWLGAGGNGRGIAARWLAAASISVAFAQITAMQRHHEDVLVLPAGRVAIPEASNAEVYQWVAAQTRPGQWFFGLPPLTLPLGLRNPTPIEAPGPGEYCRPEQIAAVIEALERTRPPLLLLRPSMYMPHLLGYRANYLKPFQEYVFRHYRRTKVFETGDEVWERAVE